MDITEFSLQETTDEEFARAIVNGGWIEYWVRCPIVGCKKPRPHRHYICSACGTIDFANKGRCRECWRMSQIYAVGNSIRAFRRKHGASMRKIGVV